MIAIQDPVHGTIEVSRDELKLIDSRPFQRLRAIRQLGFAEFAFPGATHSRYLHSLGAMEVASRMSRTIGMSLRLSSKARERFCQGARLAALFHDLGHGPLSHTAEMVMPPVQELELEEWLDSPPRRATHEDYTLKLLVHSDLCETIGSRFGGMDIDGKWLAGVISGKRPPDLGDAYTFDGEDLFFLLHQIVSGELDADRMDYLRRDAHFCGVSYGRFDCDWLIQHLHGVESDEGFVLALRKKGLWAFENFLLARYHMFLSVYYHHTALCFDHFLGRFFASGEYQLPAQIDSYLSCDDIDLLAALRKSPDPWAARICARQPYRLFLDVHGPHEQEKGSIEARLRKAEIDHFLVTRRGVLSKYGKMQLCPLLLLEEDRGRVHRIEDYTPLYERFASDLEISRVFIEPERLDDARKLL